MLKKVHFGPSYLPYLLVAPQILVTVVFFIWPAAHALYQSLLIQDAFGLSTEFVWFEKFELLFEDELEIGRPNIRPGANDEDDGERHEERRADFQVLPDEPDGVEVPLHNQAERPVGGGGRDGTAPDLDPAPASPPAAPG